MENSILENHSIEKMRKRNRKLVEDMLLEWLVNANIPYKGALSVVFSLGYDKNYDDYTTVALTLSDPDLEEEIIEFYEVRSTLDICEGTVDRMYSGLLSKENTFDFEENFFEKAIQKKQMRSSRANKGFTASIYRDRIKQAFAEKKTTVYANDSTKALVLQVVDQENRDEPDIFVRIDPVPGDITIFCAKKLSQELIQELIEKINVAQTQELLESTFGSKSKR